MDHLSAIYMDGALVTEFTSHHRADAPKPSERSILRGIEDFFDVDRVRDVAECRANSSGVDIISHIGHEIVLLHHVWCMARANMNSQYKAACLSISA